MPNPHPGPALPPYLADPQPVDWFCLAAVGIILFLVVFGWLLAGFVAGRANLTPGKVGWSEGDHPTAPPPTDGDETVLLPTLAGEDIPDWETQLPPVPVPGYGAADYGKDVHGACIDNFLAGHREWVCARCGPRLDNAAAEGRR